MESSEIFKKLFKISFLILIPLVIICGSLTVVKILTHTDTLSAYRLKNNFNKNDVRQIVSRMRSIKEFESYFQVLSEPLIDQAAHEVYSILDSYRDEKSLLEQIDQLRSRISQTAVLFKGFSYSDDFVRNPLDDPQKAEILWKFFYEDFKLSILGWCYKANHDPNFRLIWSPEVEEVASYLRMLVFSLPDSERSRINEHLLSLKRQKEYGKKDYLEFP